MKMRMLINPFLSRLPVGRSFHLRWDARKYPKCSGPSRISSRASQGKAVFVGVAVVVVVVRVGWGVMGRISEIMFDTN